MCLHAEQALVANSVQYAQKNTLEAIIVVRVLQVCVDDEDVLGCRLVTV